MKMELSFSKIGLQIREVIFSPKEFWMSVKNEEKSQLELLTGYFFPILILVAIAVFLGEFFESAHFYMGYAALKALREVVLFILVYFSSVFFTNELMKTFGSEKNLKAAQILVVYSSTPFLIVSFFTGLFPFLYALDIMGIYSFYIFWTGVNELLDIPVERRNSYSIITILVNFFMFSFLSILLSKLLIIYF